MSARVAAVFVNRLRKGMRLQSDPTVIYGIVGGQGTLGRPLSRADLGQKTGHNTYQIEGLPPTPICNPGRPAIEASLNPAATNDIFFVADGTGGHVFSDTLKEHNAAVANLRKIEQERAKNAADTPTLASPPGKAGAAAAAAAAAAAPAIINAPAAAPAAVPAAAPAAATGPGGIPLPTRKPKQ